MLQYIVVVATSRFRYIKTSDLVEILYQWFSVECSNLTMFKTQIEADFLGFLKYEHLVIGISTKLARTIL